MSSQPRVLLLGGHGKVSQLLTPLILSRNWHLTSVIRDRAQEPTITALAPSSHVQNLDVLVFSVEDSHAEAKSIIASTKPDYVVWSAGAGGKGGPERTKAVDQVAAIAFIKAAAEEGSGVSKFLLVSYVGSRAKKAPWWSEEEWKASQDGNNGALRNYYPAKLAADRVLTAAGRKRGNGFAAICLRPGSLGDEEEEGLVSLGKTNARGKISRSDVARVAAELLDRVGRSCWLDLLEGEEKIKDAVERCVREGVDTVEGEDVEG
ncbi:uncharacterized protein KY384_006540 [Bacidia gigantensis]|uniref:uncharacterized protein n=1 Tax=Bacidia gigantensis TaxID=2732470 RepID=UPI001D039ED8|nr:uncharacterized protein KY384_006540 [Bacidia gigantensis]KAG8528851.1 hypothetical protein KY384_006540 [Bacidia gigantensis]